MAYDPLDFMAKLAALIPRPHKNLVVYHGALAGRSRWRAQVVSDRREPDAARESSAVPDLAPKSVGL